MLTFRRGAWTVEEDRAMIDLLSDHGARDWVKISGLLATRTPKQCRERYCQILRPGLNHSPITEEEGRIILELVSQMGTRWAHIARKLANRSDNIVKNWWYANVQRRRRVTNRKFLFVSGLSQDPLVRSKRSQDSPSTVEPVIRSVGLQPCSTWSLASNGGEDTISSGTMPQPQLSYRHPDTSFLLDAPSIDRQVIPHHGSSHNPRLQYTSIPPQIQSIARATSWPTSWPTHLNLPFHDGLQAHPSGFPGHSPARYWSDRVPPYRRPASLSWPQT